MEPRAGLPRAAPDHGAGSDDSWNGSMAKALLIYAGAALAEIAGCFAFWIWLRSGKSPVWVLPGIVSLVAFAWLLTLIDSDYAGPAYGCLRRCLRSGLYRLALVPGGIATRSLGHCRGRLGSRRVGHHPFRSAFDVGHARRSHEASCDRSGGSGGEELDWPGRA